MPTSATILLATSAAVSPFCNMAHTLCASRLNATGSVMGHPLYRRLAMNCRSYHATISGEIPTSGGGGGACTVGGDACTVLAGGEGVGVPVGAGGGGGGMAFVLVDAEVDACAGAGSESSFCPDLGHAKCPNQTAAPTTIPASARTAAIIHVLRHVCGSPSISTVSSDHASTVADSGVRGDIDVSSVAAGPASVGEQTGSPVVSGSGPTSEGSDGGGAGGVGSLMSAVFHGCSRTKPLFTKPLDHG